MSELDRYSRQLLVSQIGADGQQRLLHARILIVGAGGLGCQVAAQLAGAGVGEIRIIDHDEVSISNLHRQILYRENDVGLSKAKISGRELSKINSQVKVTAVTQRLDTQNVVTLIQGVDLVIDAADNFATSYLLSDHCLLMRMPLLSASVNRTFGYLGVFCGDAKKPAPSLRAVFPRLPAELQSCDTVGVTGPSVGVIASLQAQEALKVLLDDSAQLLGKLLYCDLWNYRQHVVDFSTAPEPHSNQIELLNVDELSTSDLVIDVRNTAEVTIAPQTFKVDQNTPLAELDAKNLNLPNGCRVVLACASGQRALIGAQQLIDQGVAQVAALIPNSVTPNQ